MGRVYQLGGLTRSERDVLLALADHAHDDGTSARPGVPYLVWKLDLARSTIIEALRGLERKQIIHPTVEGKGRGNVTEYRIDLALAEEKPAFEGYGKRPKQTKENVRFSDENVRSGLARDVEASEPSLEPRDLLRESWLAKAPPLQRHRGSYFESSAALRKAAKAALAIYPVEDVCRAIENYATVLGSPDYRWSYSWTLDQFLTRGLDRFVEEAEPLLNFRDRKARDRDRDGGEQRTPAERLSLAEAWVLNTAWRLPLEEYEVAEQLGQRGVEGPDRSHLLDLWRQKRELAA